MSLDEPLRTAIPLSDPLLREEVVLATFVHKKEMGDMLEAGGGWCSRVERLGKPDSQERRAGLGGLSTSQ